VAARWDLNPRASGDINRTPLFFFLLKSYLYKENKVEM